MRRRIFWALVAVPLALVVIGGGAAFSMPIVRQIISGLWNLPDRLPSLPENAQVHYQPGAEDYARDVAALLPDAIKKVEAAQGRSFAHPVTVGVYATAEAYLAANAVGSTIPVGVTAFGRVNLSPKLFMPQHERLRAILTHELSHAHLFGWISQYAMLRLPVWFKEGLAVMVSEGGGAELVSEAEARAAIQRGESLIITDTGPLQNPADLRLEKTPVTTQSWYPMVLSYREAGMFVSYLRRTDGPGFERMMDAILGGSAFSDAVKLGYNDDVRSLWRRFSTSNASQ